MHTIGNRLRYKNRIAIQCWGCQHSHEVVCIWNSLKTTSIMYALCTQICNAYDTLVGPLGHCVVANDHALFVCLFCGCVLNSVHFINATLTFAHYNEVVTFCNGFHSFFRLSVCVPSPRRSRGDAVPPHQLMCPNLDKMNNLHYWGICFNTNQRSSLGLCNVTKWNQYENLYVRWHI